MNTFSPLNGNDYHSSARLGSDSNDGGMYRQNLRGQSQNAPGYFDEQRKTRSDEHHQGRNDRLIKTRPAEKWYGISREEENIFFFTLESALFFLRVFAGCVLRSLENSLVSKKVGLNFCKAYSHIFFCIKLTYHLLKMLQQKIFKIMADNQSAKIIKMAKNFRPPLIVSSPKFPYSTPSKT